MADGGVAALQQHWHGGGAAFADGTGDHDVRAAGQFVETRREFRKWNDMSRGRPRAEEVFPRLPHVEDTKARRGRREEFPELRMGNGVLTFDRKDAVESDVGGRGDGGILS